MSTALLTRPEAKPPAEPAPRRTRPRRILGAAFAAAVLAGTAVAVIDGGAAAAPPAGSCLSARTLPCGAATGTTIGGVTIDATTRGANGETATVAVLSHVLGFPAAQISIHPAAPALTGDGTGFSFTPADLRGTDRFSWTYTGTDSRLGYLGVTTDRGLAVVGVAALRSGTVDLTALLGDAHVIDVQPWITTAMFAQPVAATRLHGSGFLGNSMIGRITNGMVACVGVDTAEPAYCPFDKTTGAWMESADGDWALAARPTSLTGDPGPDWITAGAVNPDGTYPALMPTGHDTAGTATGEELGSGSTPEQFNTATNSTRRLLENVATRDVCVSSNPHPDLARFSHSPTPGVYCYTGRGAGLNDPNGRERDANGNYLRQNHHSHFVLIDATHSVWAAKRPETVNTPPPARVKPNSPLFWRPVSPLKMVN